MSDIRQWQKEKPSYYRVAILMPLFLSDIVFDQLKDHYKKLYVKGWNSISNIKEWIGYYIKPNIVIRKSQEIIIEYLKRDEFFFEAILIIVKTIYENEKKEFRLLIDDFFDLIPMNTRSEIYEKYKDHEWDDKYEIIIEQNLLPNDINKILYIPEIVFIVRVYLPCILILGKKPERLFKEAKRGKLISLCNLLRMDKGIIYDSDIAGIIHKCSLDINSSEFKKIRNAFSSTVTSKQYNKAAMIFRIGAFIEIISEKYGTPLRRKEIEDLFNDLAEFGTGRRVHVDIQSGEALAKGIQRARKNLL